METDPANGDPVYPAGTGERPQSVVVVAVSTLSDAGQLRWRVKTEKLLRTPLTLPPALLSGRDLYVYQWPQTDAIF